MQVKNIINYTNQESFSGNYVSRKMLKKPVYPSTIVDTTKKDNLYKHYLHKKFQAEKDNFALMMEIEKIMQMLGF